MVANLIIKSSVIVLPLLTVSSVYNELGHNFDTFVSINTSLNISLFFSVQVGYDMSRLAAKKCYVAAGLKPSDVNVVELHDCFSANELITYEALGLCPEGTDAALKP